MLLTKTSIVTKNQYNISLTNVATLIETIYPGHGKYIPHYPAPVDSHQITLANLRGGVPLTRAPSGSKFFQFHAVFGKIWQNCMLAPPPPEGWRPHFGEILDQPLNYMQNLACHLSHVSFSDRCIEVYEGPLTMGKDNFPLYKESYNQ